MIKPGLGQGERATCALSIEDQMRARRILKTWRCSCEAAIGCECWTYQYLLRLAQTGSAFFESQEGLIESLLQRPTK